MREEPTGPVSQSMAIFNLKTFATAASSDVLGYLGFDTKYIGDETEGGVC